jgi:radical SAM superfamily enzyme YgiQ (UPF0313 family)
MNSGFKKILLASLPFWTPLIPPLGLACLKSYLQRQGFAVTAVDANVEDRFKEIYDNYFGVLADLVPADNRGNFYSIGHEVLRSHLLAHLYHQDKKDRYFELVKVIVQTTFFCSIPHQGVKDLHVVVQRFYRELEAWFLELLDRVKPGLLGLSVYSDTTPASLFAFQLTRRKYPHIKTVMGGGVFADQLAFNSHNLEVFLEKTKPFIDKIIIGEGEELFLKLVRGELPESQRVYTLGDLAGKHLDLSSSTLDVPDFSDFDVDFYPYMTTYISRSCPFQCNFCAETVNWGKYRKKNIERAVGELAELYKRYGYQLFLIGDSLLNPVVTGLARELLKADLPVYWDGYLRADPQVCNAENALLWRKGGFYRARLGIESGSPRVLEAMGKKITPRQIKQAISSLAYAGIKTTTYWIMGFPGESEEDFLQTLELVSELKENIYEAECKPFYYFPGGQVGSEQWMSRYKRVPVYPESAGDMLLLESWRLDCLPGREETYRRVGRFIRHCKDLGIPNPYSMAEIYRADERWRKLHKNAVPPLVELRNKNKPVRESRDVRPLNFARNVLPEDDDFGF